MPKLRPLLVAGVLLLPMVAIAQTAPAATPPPAAAPAASTASKKVMPPAPEKLPPPKWNGATVVTVKGKLIGVWRSKRFGVVVGLDTGEGADDVILLDIGPAYFVDPKITFAAGDAIEARGSRVTFTNHMPGMLVTWFKRGTTTVNVRTDRGKSLW